MKYSYYSFFFLIFALSTSVRECEKVKKNKDGTIVKAFVNNKPMQECEITISVSKTNNNYTAKTNAFGIASIKSRGSDIGRESLITLKSASYNIDTSLILPLRNYVEIQLNSFGEIKYSRDSIKVVAQGQQDTLSKISFALADIEADILSVEKELNNYLTNHPGSALTNYSSILETRKREYKILKERVLDLTTRYQNLVDSLNNGYTPDVSALRTKLMSIKRNKENFLRNWSKTSIATNVNLAAKADEIFSFDILFRSGKFMFDDLETSQINILSDYASRINNTLHELEDLNRNNLVLILKTTGFTDGTNVMPEWVYFIKENCKGEDKYYNSNDANDCLSYLRAKTVNEYILNSLSPKSKSILIQKVIIGEGRNGVSEGDISPSLRRCKASFTVIPDEIKKENKYN